MQDFCYVRINKSRIAWMAAALLAPITLGLACTAALSDTTTDQSTLNIIRNVMSFISERHADAAPYINSNIVFKKDDSGPKGKVGYSKAVYHGAGWTITVGHAVTAEVIYEISADYAGGKITWSGTSQDGVVSEVKYTKAE